MEDIKEQIRKLEIVTVDPNMDTRDLLKLQFSKYGFNHIRTFENGRQLLDHLNKTEMKFGTMPSLAIVDVMLPEMDGFELCKKVSADFKIPVLLLSARLEAGDEVRGLESGARDYMTKPYNFQVLLLKVEKILTQHSLAEEVRTSNDRSQKLFLNILQVMAKTLEAKDPYSSFHSLNVSSYARELARVAGFSQKDVSLIGIAGMLHDIGKIGIQESILQKEGPLTDEEYQRIKKHPMIAAVILEPVDELSSIIDTVKHHHEWYNGKGYPAGLKGEDIPLGARIMAIADSYDAMTTSRPYRHTPVTEENAISELRKGSGTQFDPGLVDLFIDKVLAKKNPHKKPL